MKPPVVYYEDREIEIPEEGLLGIDSLGVQLIVIDHPQCGYEHISGGDFFINRDGTWLPVDVWGLIDFIIFHCPNIAVGRLLPAGEFDAVKTRAHADFPRTGRPARERE